MADIVGTAASGHPNLNLTPEEKRVYGQLFKEADPDGFGAVSGDVAVKFFEKTKLAPDVLGQIWQIADTENRGFLTPSGFGVVLRLIGHAQAGRVPTPQLATQPAPLPRFDSPPAQPISAQSTGTPASPGKVALPPIRVPALTPEKASEYSSLFDKSGAENGSLPGVVAKQIFERARLPNEVLGRIWNLSDTQGRGALDSTEFVIAMHMLASYKSGAMRGVPPTLPPGLYEAANRRQPGRPASFSRPGSGALPASSIPPQFSGYANQRPQSPISRQQVSTPLSAQSTGEGWAITPADKIRFDQLFAGLDIPGRGFITGDQAVNFFGNAKLPEEVLAQIWDLADINSEGQLNKDEFAVAMYLIRQQLGTRDGRGNLPATLPPALVPPSMRKQQAPPSQPTAPAFGNATVTQPRSAADDLFGLDAFAAPAPTLAAPAQAPQSTGGTDSGPFANPRSPAPGAVSSPSSTFKPFVPSSSFGQSILPQQTGPTNMAQARNLPSQTQASDDLLGDADPEVSQRLTSETSELANLSNQVGNLSKQTAEVQSTRRQTEQELNHSKQQKRDFEARLGQLRSLYEQEVKDVKSLQTQLATSRNETKRLQQDMAMIDGTHQDLRTQHQQLSAALHADQQENTSLKEKIRQMNGEIEQLRPQLEKLKSDARQQKGLVAINKKQLSTNESERDRIKVEMSAASKEADDASREAEETARQVEASNKELEQARNAPQPSIRSPANVVSPAPSTSSNPFFRNAAFSPPIAESPTPADSLSAFDNIFGPSIGASSHAPAPATSFGTESPMQKREVSGLSDSIGTDSPSSFAPPPDVRPSTKQITSASLPFRIPLDRADSISSSVKVAPPVSRLSPADTPRALTPAESSSGHPSQHEIPEDPFESTTPVGGSVAAGNPFPEDVASPTSPGDHLATDRASSSGTAERTDDIPGAFPTAETPRSGTPYQNVPAAAIAAGAGAATPAAGAGIAAAATHENNKNNEEEPKNKQPESQSSEEPNVSNSNFDDFFGGPAHQRTRSEQVADFDLAFAGMKSGPITNGTTNGNREFPDIQEIDGDESSEYSEETPIGFDDDFNAKSPPRPPKLPEDNISAKESQPAATSAVLGHLQAPRPTFETASSTASSLPGINSQTSPPAYSDSVPANDPAHFPPEFTGLLPSRQDPTSLPADSSPGQHEVPSYGPEVARSENVPTAATGTKSSPFDFDSAFAGMAPAQIEDEDNDDEESFSPTRNHASQFDPTFDSSPIQSRSTTGASNAAPTSVYSAVTNGPQYTPSQSTKSTTNDFDNFENSFSTAPAPAGTGQTTATGTSHDWDTMFAGIDAPPTSSGADMTATSHAVPPTSSVETSAAPPSISPASAAKTQPSRPALGRAVTEGTEHDDPILKRLTAMGWSRDESLKALEQFDYNIDKAADHLMFKSGDGS